ncbi:hypothetical protein BJF84_12560 [Rhodococcus sp. CUA-806]|nr:hypothetical protein BJF84_12560 [Rhodococcus sp. CUA-806]
MTISQTHGDSVGTISQMQANENFGSYGSANDLPTMIQLRQDLANLRTFSLLLRQDRKPLKELERQLDALTTTVDRFYKLTGPRHWIFTDYLPLSSVEELVSAGHDAIEAEARLVEIIAERITSPYWHLGLTRHEDMRARTSHLERARQHYIDQQWDSCALMLVTVMDGFVNDVEKAHRRGLHAREPDEMVVWDSMSGHHLGLTAVMRVFLKSFRRRHDEEVFELHRHGIVHGNITNYNNRVVATKAWNMLAALADWASGLEKKAAEPEVSPTLRGTLSMLMRQAKTRQYREQFTRSITRSTDSRFVDLPVAKTAKAFLDAWSRQQWAVVAEALPISGKVRVDSSKRAVEAKRLFAQFVLDSPDIEQVEFDQPSAAAIAGSVGITDNTGKRSHYRLEIRWIHEHADGLLAIPSDTDSRWVLAVVAPNSYFHEI